jgi:hypothetical protein
VPIMSQCNDSDCASWLSPLRVRLVIIMMMLLARADSETVARALGPVLNQGYQGASGSIRKQDQGWAEDIRFPLPVISRADSTHSQPLWLRAVQGQCRPVLHSREAVRA